MRAPLSGPRVLHVSQPTDAGVAVTVLGLVEHQIDAGYRVTLACPAAGMLAARAAAAGCAVVTWNAGRNPGPGLAREFRSLRRIVQVTRPDLVHLHSSKAGLVGRIVIRRRVPTIFQPHAWSFLAIEGHQARLARAWERFAVRWTDWIVAVSETERTLGISAGIAAPTRVIPNGVDTAQFSPVGLVERASRRTNLGLTAGDVVMCVGRLCRQKGQDIALDAWDRVHSRFPDATLVFVGDGPDRAALEARSLPSVRFVGSTSLVAEWLSVADVVIAPSRWEGQSLVLLEALSSGASVVASDVAGVREAIPTGGGAIVPIGDAAALADAVTARLADPEVRASEGVAARVAALDAFAFGRTAAATMGLYAELLAAHELRSCSRGGGRTGKRRLKRPLRSYP